MIRMVRTLIASGMLLALSSRACGAGVPSPAGFGLAWHDCIGLPGAAANLDYACDGSRDGNPFRLVVTFTTGWEMEHFVGADIVLSVRTSASVLPDWWRFADGECRAGRLVFPGSRAGIGTGASGACIDPWAGANTGGVFLWFSDMAYGCGRFGCSTYPTPGYGALRIAYARDTEVALHAGQRYLIAPILIDPADPHVNPDDSCSGCAATACLYVQQVELLQPAGQIPPQQDIYVLSETTERPYVTWQNAGIPGDGCPLEVPVRNTTWGAIKAIYR